MNCTLIIVTLFILDRPFFGTSTKKKESWKKKKKDRRKDNWKGRSKKQKEKKKKRKLERERGGERRKLIKEGNILNIKEGG